MPGGFVLERQNRITHIAARLIHHQGIFQGAAADQAGKTKEKDLAPETECAAGSDIADIVGRSIETGLLHPDNLRFEIDGHFCLKAVEGFQSDAGATSGIFIDERTADGQRNPLLGLFLQPARDKGFGIRPGASVEYRNFRGVEPHQRIIHTQAGQGGQQMFRRKNPYAS